MNEVEKHLAEGKRLLQEGQLSEALYHYAAAVGERMLTDEICHVVIHHTIGYTNRNIIILTLTSSTLALSIVSANVEEVNVSVCSYRM